MDITATINELRAQFLRVCPERDQARRMIKPLDGATQRDILDHDYGVLDGRIRELYRDVDGTDMLALLESPPITSDFMLNYLGSIRHNRFQHEDDLHDAVGASAEDGDRGKVDHTIEDFTYNQDEPSIHDQRLPEPEFHDRNENDTSADARPTEMGNELSSLDGTIRGDSVLALDSDTEGNVKATTDTNEDVSQGHTSGSNGGDQDRRSVRKSSIPFKNIFKPKRDPSSPSIASSAYNSHSHSHYSSQSKMVSEGAILGTVPDLSNNNNNNNNNRNDGGSSGTSSSGRGATDGTTKLSAKKESKYSMNFDYDETIDDEDEDDDEDDEAAYKMQAKFFQTEGQVVVKENSAMFGKPQENNRQPTSNFRKPSGLLPSKSNGDEKSNGVLNSDPESKVPDSSLGNVTGEISPLPSAVNNTNNDRSSNYPPGSSRSNSIAEGSSARNILTDNVSKLKSHLPQLSILDTNRHQNGLRTENMNSHNTVNGGKLRSKTNMESISSLDPEEDSKQEVSDFSDIESYIDEHDIDNFSIDKVESGMSNRHDSVQHSSRYSKYKESVEDLSSNTISNSDTRNFSTASSYTRLLSFESDFTPNQFSKEPESLMISRSGSLDTDIVSQSFSSYSMPVSFDDYSVLADDGNLTVTNIFDKAMKNISYSNKRFQVRDEKLLDLSQNSPNVPGLSKLKRMSMSAIPSSRKVTRLRSSSTNSGDRIRRFGILDSSIQPFENSPAPNSSNSKALKGFSKGDKNKATNGGIKPLTFEKLDNFDVKTSLASNLSSLFSRKNKKLTDPSEALEYFSFVSGDSVPKAEAIQLDVYIHDSQRYRHKFFNINVKKEAKVFDVIGYVLYRYATTFKPSNFEEDGFPISKLVDPNWFALHIVDENGEPFEDNFGKLNRTNSIQYLSDNEVVLCCVTEEEKLANEGETPVPYDLKDDVIDYARGISSKLSATGEVDHNDEPKPLNQLSFYRPIVGNTNTLVKSGAASSSAKMIEITVYMYPNVNPKYNYTTVNVLVTSSINDILVQYCRMKRMNPSEYLLKVVGENLVLDLNDTVLRLDGKNMVEIISKKEARKLQLEKIKPNLNKPQLPTIQSNDLTPLTLPDQSYLQKPGETAAPVADPNTATTTTTATAATTAITPTTSVASTTSTNNKKHVLKSRRSSTKYRLNLTKQSPVGSISNHNSTSENGIFKLKNPSRGSLYASLPFYHQNYPNTLFGQSPGAASVGNNYQDLFSGAYHKYKVWRRQQMSLISKHERTLALDGDYVYIVPPEGKMHWHENVKTKSFHISQVVLVKKSKRVPEYFKIYVARGPDVIKRYYFEAVSEQECSEIVIRIQSQLSAYKMNHK